MFISNVLIILIMMMMMMNSKYLATFKNNTSLALGSSFIQVFISLCNNNNDDDDDDDDNDDDDTFSITLFPAERAQRACLHTCT